MKNLVPLAFLIGGIAGCLYYAFQALSHPESEFVIQFAIASLFAVIGWREIRATEDFEESN